MDKMKSSKPLAFNNHKKPLKDVITKEEADIVDEPGEAYLDAIVDSVTMPKNKK